jgi:hypothetical protein
MGSLTFLFAGNENCIHWQGSWSVCIILLLIITWSSSYSASHRSVIRQWEGCACHLIYRMRQRNLMVFSITGLKNHQVSQLHPVYDIHLLKVKGIEVTQDRVHWQVVVNTVNDSGFLDSCRFIFDWLCCDSFSTRISFHIVNWLDSLLLLYAACRNCCFFFKYLCWPSYFVALAATVSWHIVSIFADSLMRGGMKVNLSFFPSSPPRNCNYDYS